MTRPRRFTATTGRIDGERVTFDRDESRHMRQVLRLRAGDVVVAGDGAGGDLTVRLDALADTASGTIIAVSASGAESPLALTLVQGIPKGDRMERIVRAATELGVRRIVPVIAERTVVHLDAGGWRERARRWQRIASEAAKQSGRSFIPEMDLPRTLTASPDHAADFRLCLWEGAVQSLADALASAPGAPTSIAVLVGPEGGLSPGEVEHVRRLGWSVARMGPRILRTETAGPAVAAVLQFHFGDLGGGRASSK